MRLYTSYYARVVRASDDILLIRVSNTVPDWFNREYHTLSVNVFPDWKFINAFKKDEISYETFCAEYRKKIAGTTRLVKSWMRLKGWQKNVVKIK